MNEDIEDLVNEVRLLFHQFVQAGERLHEDETVTIAMRAVLEYLVRNGSSTVPDIARSRHVSRQHIQTLVNALVEVDAVELAENPAHKRSSLVVLTSDGKRTIDRMRKREARFFAKTDFGVSQTEMRKAVRTLRSVRNALGESA